MDLLSRPVPEPLEPLLLASSQPGEAGAGGESSPGRRVLVRIQHKLGPVLKVMARELPLRDGLGQRVGISVIFHPAETMDALPHGEYGGDGSADEESQTEFEERLAALFEDFQQGGESFGVLWITVDQAQDLRRTHGAGACETMLEKVERAFANGLRPSEEWGRWGDDEFLILSHERTPEMLAAHAQMLAGLARTADFRWWGDRVSITVSIGAAQAEREETLAGLLDRAKEAMFTSRREGGNHITSAPGVQACLPS
jgi:diguanylate cyclase (GGDEF)-like protein